MTPRISMFTPYKVARGPGKGVSLKKSRFTCGVTENGEAFEFFDDWTIPDCSHRILNEPWIGYTVFVEQGSTHEGYQKSRPGAVRFSAGAGAWSEASEGEL